MAKGLCQDCLSFLEYEENKSSEICPVCGGEICFCPECVEIGEMLLVGERDYKELGLLKPIYGWTAEGGYK